MQVLVSGILFVAPGPDVSSDVSHTRSVVHHKWSGASRHHPRLSSVLSQLHLQLRQGSQPVREAFRITTEFAAGAGPRSFDASVRRSGKPMQVWVAAVLQSRTRGPRHAVRR
jgi:hypothetical protein